MKKMKIYIMVIILSSLIIFSSCSLKVDNNSNDNNQDIKIKDTTKDFESFLDWFVLDINASWKNLNKMEEYIDETYWFYVIYNVWVGQELYYLDDFSDFIDEFGFTSFWGHWLYKSENDLIKCNKLSYNLPNNLIDCSLDENIIIKWCFDLWNNFDGEFSSFLENDWNDEEELERFWTIENIKEIDNIIIRWVYIDWYKFYFSSDNHLIWIDITDYCSA